MFDSVLVVVVSVIEVVFNAFSLLFDDNSVFGVVVNESDAFFFGLFFIVVDERFN